MPDKSLGELAPFIHSSNEGSGSNSFEKDLAPFIRQPETKPIKSIAPPTPTKKSNEDADFYMDTLFGRQMLASPDLNLINPPGGRDELGRPLDENGNPYDTGIPPSVGFNKQTKSPGEDAILNPTLKLLSPIANDALNLAYNPMAKKEFEQGFMNTAKDYWGAVKNPMEAIKGGLYTVTDLITFPFEALTSLGNVLNTLVGGDFTIEDLYNSFHEGVKEGSKLYGTDALTKLTGPRTKESEIIGQTAFAPAILMNTAANSMANSELFKNHPNVRGAIKFAGDMAAMYAMGKFEVIPALKSLVGTDMEKVGNKAIELATEYEAAKNNPNVDATMEFTKKADDLEAEATDVKDTIKARSDIINKAKEVENIKKGEEKEPSPTTEEPTPPATEEPTPEDIGIDEDLATIRAIEKHYGRKIDDISDDEIEKWFIKKFKEEGFTEEEEAPREPIPQELRPLAMTAIDYDSPEDFINNYVFKSKENFLSTIKLLHDQGIDVSYSTHKGMSEADWRDNILTPALTKFYNQAKSDVSLTSNSADIDYQIGAEEPDELRTEQSPFREKDPEATAKQLKLLSEKNTAGNPDLTLAKLVTQINSWLDGNDEIDIKEVKNNLSDLALAVNDPAGKIALSNYFGGRTLDTNDFIDAVNESAKWARRADRPSKSEGMRLNMMIPVDEIPERVRSLVKDISKAKVRAGELYRNLDIWKKTGFWLGRDWKWRYEIDDSKAKFNFKALDNANKPVPLTDVVDYPDLFDAVPGMKDTKIKFSPYGHTEYNPDTDTISLRHHSKVDAIHEMQHAVSEKLEAFVGGSPDAIAKDMRNKEILNRLIEILTEVKYSEDRNYIANAIKELDSSMKEGSAADWSEWFESLHRYLRVKGEYDAAKIAEPPLPPVRDAYTRYLKIPGEMESRLVEKRFHMSAKERRTIPPWETLDRMLRDEGLLTDEEYEGKKVSPSAGHKLYDIGGATEEAVKRAAKKSYELFKEAKRKAEEDRAYKKFNLRLALKMTKEEFNRLFISRSGNIRRRLLEVLDNAGYKAVQAMNLVKGSSALATNMLKQMTKEVYGGLSKHKTEVLDNLIFYARILDLAKYKTPKEFKELAKYTPEEAANYLRTFGQFENLTPEEAYDLYHVNEDGSIGGRTGAYFDWMRRALKDMHERGLLSDKDYEDLSTHNYRRLKVADLIDTEAPSLGKKRINVYDSGIEKLAEGKETTIFERNSRIMALETFSRAYGRILKNEANKVLAEIAENIPNNPFVRAKGADDIEGYYKVNYFDKKGIKRTIHIKDSVDLFKDFANKTMDKEESALLNEFLDSDVGHKYTKLPRSKIPHGWRKISYFDKGEKKDLYISPDMAKEWLYNDPELGYRTAQIVRLVSGSAVLKTFATGINWGFALANLPRDVLQAWFAARYYANGKWHSLYSPLLPKFAGQMTRDQLAVFNDALLRKGRYNDYIEDGGGMEFLVLQGRLAKRGLHLDSNLDKIQDFLGYFGATSELMTRLAIRERFIRMKAEKLGISMEEARKDPEIRREATFVARDYLDFSQGGGFIKAADVGIPYLSPAIQGARTFLRSFKPGSGTALASTFKLAQFAGVTSALYIASRHYAPETMKALQGDINMQNNICIPLGDGFSFLDEHGERRYIYLKIPLDPSAKFFKTFFEAATDKWLGNEVDVDRVTGALKQFSPVGSSPSDVLWPTIIGALGYATNKNFWRNKDIWTKTDSLSFPRSGEEYTKDTPQIYIDLFTRKHVDPETGEVTRRGLSPERMRYLVNQLVPRGTLWGALVGKGYDELFGGLPEEKKQQHLAMVLSKSPVIRRFIGVTNPYSKHAKEIKNAREESVLDKFVENRAFDLKVDAYLYGKKGVVTRADVLDEARKYGNKDTFNRLMNRLKFEEGIKDLPDKSFWRKMKGLTPDARARVFVDELSKANDKEKSQLWDDVRYLSRTDKSGNLRVKGVITPDFKHEVVKLMNER